MRPIPRWEPTAVKCQRCRGWFQRPRHLAPHVPFVRCEPCWALEDEIERKRVLVAETLRRAEREKQRHKVRLTEHILHPALTNVAEVQVRKPGERGWAAAEAGG